MNLTANLVQWAKGCSTHDRVASRVVPAHAACAPAADIRRPDVNALLLTGRGSFPAASTSAPATQGSRTLPAEKLTRLVHEQPHFRAQVRRLPTQALEQQQLLRLFGPPLQDLDAEVRGFLTQDICTVAGVFRDLGYEYVNVKLEAVGSTSCPQWHADHVTLRALVTYVGEGTWFIDNKHVTRSWKLLDGPLVVSVGGVDEAHALQAGPGDLLLLKGHQWEGNLGLGAVHRSPDVDPGSPDQTRLLLTVDDVVEEPCGCGASH